MPKKKKKDALSQLGGMGIGIAKGTVGLSVGAVVGSRAIAQAPAAHQPALGVAQNSIGQVASAYPIATIVGVGGTLLGSLKSLNKKKKGSK